MVRQLRYDLHAAIIVKHVIRSFPYYGKSAAFGFTIVELLLVIAIIAIIAVLAVLSFAGMNRVRDASNRAASIENLRQVGVGIADFSADNNDCLPLSRVGSTFWPEVIYPYVSGPAVFLRPGSKNFPMDANHPDGYLGGVDAKTPEGIPIRWNYVINGGHPQLPFSESRDNPLYARGLARSMSTVEQPDRTVFMADGSGWWLNGEAKPDSNRMYRWKNATTNVLFGDGSTRNLNCKTDLTASQFLAD